MATLANVETAQYTLSPHLQADFYAKLAQIQNDVLTGKYPAYKLPQSTIDAFTKILLPLPPSLATKLPEAPPLQNGFASNSTPPEILPSQSSRPTHYVASSLVKHVPFGSRPSTSSIDPVLLTKSDDLVRAENHLKRQRIERALREAYTKQTMPHRDTLNPFETSHAFDAEKILNEALEIVKHVSGIVEAPNANGASSNHSSFDENSYYSSQGNSWVSEDIHSHKSNEAVEGGLVLPNVTGVNFPNKLSSQDSDELLCSDVQMTNYTPAPDAIQAGLVEQNEATREESYSPPAATAFQAPPTTANPVITQRPGHPQGEVHRIRASKSYSPPTTTYPTVLNHIAAPLAPQPARISSLASQQIPGLTAQRSDNIPPVLAQLTPAPYRPLNTWQKQKQGNDSDMMIDGLQAIDSPVEIPASAMPSLQNPRKRRRVLEQNETGRKTSGKRMARSARSPSAHIKAEPLSPQSRSVVVPASAPRRLILRDDGRADIEVLSSRDMRPRPVSDGREYDVSRTTSDHSSRYDPHNPYVIDSSRPASPTVRQRVGRDDVDLRRIASVQYAMRPESPPRRVISYPVEDMRFSRAPSHAVDTRPIPRQIHYVEEPVSAHSTASSYRMPDPYGLPYPRHEERAVSIVDHRTTMPPPGPKRKIIIDEDGTEWLAVAAPPRQSVAREMAPPIYEPRAYYQDDVREPPMRAVSQFIDRQPSRARTQIIDLEDDVGPRRMMLPPPPPPYVQPPQQRHQAVARYIEIPEPPSRYAEVLEPRSRFLELQEDPRYAYPRHATRAVSLAPPPPLPVHHYPPPPPPPPPLGSWLSQEAMQRGFERAYSARPVEHPVAADWRRMGR